MRLETDNRKKWRPANKKRNIGDMPMDRKCREKRAECGEGKTDRQRQADRDEKGERDETGERDEKGERGVTRAERTTETGKVESRCGRTGDRIQSGDATPGDDLRGDGGCCAAARNASPPCEWRTNARTGKTEEETAAIRRRRPMKLRESERGPEKQTPVKDDAGEKRRERQQKTKMRRRTEGRTRASRPEKMPAHQTADEAASPSQQNIWRRRGAQKKLKKKNHLKKEHQVRKTQTKRPRTQHRLQKKETTREKEMKETTSHDDGSARKEENGETEDEKTAKSRKAKLRSSPKGE
ncbi:hypothetical protein TGMAS_413050 [Toxoplasma gondii MAS]|uniref:Uncharacterized protein n=1 Tax=Toxoplasma gondii MAS TaxID=943118 RepID=A0A086QX49_TOXGO|nr:hypothetical protein TGMAS_413050 [Toxoplasma gondii MAS]